MENIGIILAAALGGVIFGVVTIGTVLLAYQRRRQPSPTPYTPELESIETYMERPSGLNVALQTGDAYQTIFEGLPAPTGNRPWLEGIGGIMAGQRIILENDECILGRSRVCDVQFPDPKVSRQHAMLRFYKGNYFLQDMQSSRGTWVNSQRIESHLLNDGDQIRMGDAVVRFRLPKESAKTNSDEPRA